MIVALRRSSPSATAVLRRCVAAATARSATRGMSSLKAFDERERAAETLWFNKQEEKVLRDLLSKMKVSNSPSCDVR